VAPIVASFVTFLFLPGYIDRGKVVRTTFWLVLAAFVLQVGLDNVETLLSDPGELVSAVIDSNVSTESGFAFIFGLLNIYFISRRERRYTVLSAIAVILSFKRVAILATLIGLGTLFFFGREFPRKRLLKLFPACMLVINGLLVFLIYQLALGRYDELIFTYLSVSTDYLLQGRIAFYTEVLNHIGAVPVWGIGLGNTQEILYAGSIFQNLHSDVLKIFLEFGVIGATIWCYTFYRLSLRSPTILAMSVYLNVLFVSDNVFIYYHILFFFYMLVIVCINQEQATPTEPIQAAEGIDRLLAMPTLTEPDR
jgi:O-antigen ligase